MPETHEIVIGVALLALILFALNDKDAITDKMLEHSPDDDDDDEARRRKVKVFALTITLRSVDSIARWTQK